MHLKNNNIEIGVGLKGQSYEGGLKSYRSGLK